MDLEIIPYTPEDDRDALLLEEKCVQGTSLQVKFCRPSFVGRSEIYDNYKIYCAKSGQKLIGVIAGTVKNVHLHGQDIRALYVYDLRVHPEYRKGGVAKKLSCVLLDDLGQDVDCIYTLINGENERALGLVRHNFGPKVIIPLTYIIFPVYKKLKEAAGAIMRNVSRIHEAYLQGNPEVEFLPSFNGKELKGYIASLDSLDSGCSVWTNENILAEQVVRIPSYFKWMRVLNTILRPFFKLPSIPRENEIIRSWFLFDLYARDKQSLHSLLASVNNFALDQGRTYLYLLLEKNAALVDLIKETGLRFFTFPYCFLAKGRVFPKEADRIYIDIRDL